MKKLEKYTLIVGGNSGIGREIATVLDRKIIIIDRQLDQTLIEKYLCYKINLSNIDEVAKITDLLVSNYNIDNVIYAAGYQEHKSFFELNYKDWEMMYKVNVFAPFILLKRIVKMMKTRKVTGNVIFISSIHGQIVREIPHYSSSKAAQDMLMKELALCVAKDGINVMSIAPGSFDTPLLRTALNSNELMESAANIVPMKRHGNVKEIGEFIRFILESDSNYLTGTVVTIDGGLSLVI